MAKVGTIKQYHGPYASGSTITLNGNCIIGISVSEDDYMQAGAGTSDSSIRFLINGQQIWMGRTFIYETQQQTNSTVVSFPDGAPSSLLLEAVYCSAE